MHSVGSVRNKIDRLVSVLLNVFADFPPFVDIEDNEIDQQFHAETGDQTADHGGGFGLRRTGHVQHVRAAAYRYSIDYGMNPVVQKNCQDLLDEAIAAYADGGEAQRRFASFAYKARSWPHQRRTIAGR